MKRFLYTLRALGIIAKHLNKLKSSRIPKNSAPLTYAPIAYLGFNVDAAQRKDFDDVALQGCDILFEVVETAPNNIDIADVHLGVINELERIAIRFFDSGKGSLANRPLEVMMKIMDLINKQKHFRFKEIIQQTLEKIAQLMPSAIKHEQTLKFSIIGLSMTPVYDLTQKFSIGYLVANLVDWTEELETRDWVNPYGKFIDLNEPIRRHFYKLGEKNDFGRSFLLWHIIKTIEHIYDVFFSLFNKPKTDDARFLKELEECSLWYLSFFWLVFNKKTSIDFQYAEEACDVLAKIGLKAIKLKYLNITDSCVDNISSIADSYMEVQRGKEIDAFNLVDLLMPMLYIRIYAERTELRDLVEKIDKKISAYEANESIRRIRETFVIRKKQLENELEGRQNLSIGDSAIGLLQVFLKE